MSETHIHIHLNGEQVASTAATQTSSKKAVSTSRRPSPKAASKTKRKPSAYNKRYATALKKIQHKHKTKSGSWKKDGYKKAVKEAHRLAMK